MGITRFESITSMRHPEALFHITVIQYVDVEDYARSHYEIGAADFNHDRLLDYGWKKLPPPPSKELDALIRAIERR